MILQRWQALYTLIIDVGEKLRTVSDPEMSTVLQEELSQLQHSWGDTQSQMEEMMMQLNSTLQVDNALPKEKQHAFLWRWVLRASVPYIPRTELCGSKRMPSGLVEAKTAVP